MVTEKMIEAFGQAFWPVNAATHIDGERDNIRAALEAALSTDAEPVGYLHEFRATNESNWARDFSFSPLLENGYVRNIKAVYAAPPAPSVAVKAQQAVWIKHDGKRIPVNAETIVEVRMASGFEHEADFAGNWLEREGSKSNWHHDLGCPHPCDIVAYRIVTNSAALSAQVQDVAGWQSGINEAIAVADSEAAMWGHEAGSSARTVAARLRTLLAAAPAAKQEPKVTASIKILVHYAHCCNGSTKFCDCTNKNHGTVWIDQNSIADDYVMVTD